MRMPGMGELLILLVFAALLVPVLLQAGVRAVSATAPSPYDGRSRRASLEESTRLASASGILLGSVFRRNVIDRARDKHHACSPELGLDLKTVLHVCHWSERREVWYDAALGSGTMLLIFLFLSKDYLLAGAAAALLVTGIFYKRFEERFLLTRPFRRGQFDVESVRRAFSTTLTEVEIAGLPREDQNVLAYSGFSPFEGAGIPVGGWSLVVDASRGKQSHGPTPGDVEPFDAGDVSSAVEGAIAEIGHNGLRCRDYLVLHGSNLPNFLAPEIGGAWRPVQRAYPTRADQNDDLDDRARRYKWIQIYDWGGEMVVSSFFYCVRVANDVFVECRHYLLTAASPRYRQVDALTNSTWWTIVRWIVARAILALPDAVASVVWLVYRPLAALPKVTGLKEWWWRVVMADEPRYNYGGDVSVRQMIAGSSYTHYFQKTDQELLSKLVDKRILDGLVDFLDKRGVDTSEIKERQTTILNNGIYVHGGNVEAQSLAVGRGARASSLFSQLRRRREARVSKSA